MNWPAADTRVTLTVSIRGRELSVVNQAARDNGTGTMPFGMLRHSQVALMSDSRLIKPKAYRHPHVPPSQAPRGVPKTEAIDQPKKMNVMARPRCSAGTSKPTQDAACGVKMAAPAMAIARHPSRVENCVEPAASACNTLYHSKLAVSNFCRSHPATQAANKGAPKHVRSADVEISCPAVAMDTFSEVLTSVKMPVAIMTPVAITKLPNINGQSTRGKGDFKASPKGLLQDHGSATDLQSARIDDVGRRALDEIHHVVKSRAKVQLVVVFLDIANVRRTDAVFQAQQSMALQNRLDFNDVDSGQTGAASVESADQGVLFNEFCA
jgi:hypothetical protein